MGGADASTFTGVEPHRLSSAEPFDQARFIPGAMLAGRYRIVSLLGRGGMGDVYRAEDLKLGQPVALKFLPKDMAHRADRLTRLHNEVRVARQMSHPNVCRVYDIGEADGQHFLSIERFSQAGLQNVADRGIARQAVRNLIRDATEAATAKAHTTASVRSNLVRAAVPPVSETRR